MGRLLKIWHQTGAGDKVLLTMNQYNELGQLIDKKLHNTDPTSTADASRKFRQSIDYRYNIRGWLSSVNNSKLEVNSTNDDVNDLFGMNLLYDSVDAGIGNTPQYNGNISSMKWSRNAATGFVKDLAYRYAYDTLNRLKSANFLKDSVTWTNPDLTFNETNFAYDRNGNIRHLERTGRKGSSMDVLSYSYATTGTLSNKLMSVTDAGLSAQGFTDGNAGSDDYTYDTNGSMTADKNKGVSAITYNFLHLPDKVTKTDNAFIQYVYDATGQKRQQQVFDKNAVLTKKADYLGEMYFENDTLKFTHHDEGRIILTEAMPEYQYDLKDHLGNVRMTFTSKAEVDSALATLETAKVSSEQAKFLYYDEAVKINAAIFDHTDAGATYYSTRLNGSASERSGLAKSLSVMPGDTINAKVYAKYLDPDHGNWTGFDLATLIASYSNPAAGTFIDGGLSGSTGGVTAPFLGQLDKGGESGTAPKAFLNYVVFDGDYHFVDGGFVRVSTDAREYGQDGPHQELSSQIVITQPGYVYIYLSNDNVALGGSAVEVYFDDFEVNHIKSPVVQSQDYYPFGLTFNSYQRENSLLNKWKFQSQEHVDDLGLNWDRFKWRNHQPDIGRFFNVDPLAEKYFYNSTYAFSENKVVAHIELEGLESARFEVRMMDTNAQLKGKQTVANTAGDNPHYSYVGFTVDFAKKSLSVTKNTSWDNPFFLDLKNVPATGATNTVDFEPELTAGEDGSFNIHGDLSFWGATDVDMNVKLNESSLEINTSVDDISPTRSVTVFAGDESGNDAGYGRSNSVLVGHSSPSAPGVRFKDKSINQKSSVPLQKSDANKVIFDQKFKDDHQKSDGSVALENNQE